MSSESRHVLLAVCGGIAAYKACEVLRGLQKAGCEVRVTMTADAERFVGPATFEGLTRHAVADDLYDYPETAIPHIDLAEWADLVVVVPATANVMAKMAAGLADDCLSTTLLAAACPVLVAPGMNVHMWQNAATQANLRTLRARGVGFVLPVEGRLACGDVGAGKLADVEDIVSAALAALDAPRAEKDLQLTRILVTAGPTHEAIDPVRYIANASTGKMGYAIAAAAARRGAQVTLVSGPTALQVPEGVVRMDVTSAQEMYEAVMAAFPGCDAAICTAAVADYTPVAPADHKLKKAHEHLDSIELVETRDILASLCSQKGERVVAPAGKAEWRRRASSSALPPRPTTSLPTRRPSSHARGPTSSSQTTSPARTPPSAPTRAASRSSHPRASRSARPGRFPRWQRTSWTPRATF